MNRDKKKIDWNKRWDILNQKINNMKEIDWTKVKSGDRFTAEIDGEKCIGKIQKEANCVFLCQNKKKGLSCKNKQGYKCSWVYTNNYKNFKSIYVKDLKIISQTKKPMAKKTTPKKNPSRNKEYTFISYQTVGKAAWELYAYHDANNEKTSSFKIDGKKYTGNFCYGNRLKSTANGNILTGNKGFDTKQAAFKNVVLVGKVSGMIPVSAKGGSVGIFSMNAYLTIRGQKVAVKKKAELIAGVTVKNGKRVDAVKKVTKAKK